MTTSRVIAYTPNGASLGPLPTPGDVAVGFPLNDVGAMTLNYPPTAPRAEVLGQPLELALEVSHDQGATWTEPPSARFLYLRDGRDPLRTDDAFQVDAAAYVQRLAKGLIGFTGLNAEGMRQFVNATPGAILHTLLTEAQSRGALTGLTWAFTPTADSSGAAWPARIPDVAYEAGKDLLSVLTDMVEAAFVDFRTQGRALQVYAAETAMATDRTITATPVVLRYGRDLTEAPFRRTWEALADTALVKGDGTARTERTNAGALRPWGRQETFVTASGSSDVGTLSVIGDAALKLTAGARAEYTFGLEFGAAPHLPMRDYAPGEWVSVATGDGTVPPERMRVRQVTLTRNAQGQTAGNVVLNDRFLEADVRTARLIDRLTNGATVAGTGTTPSEGSGADILAPNKPVGLTASSNVYTDPGGFTRGQILLDWSDVTTNADGTPSTDVKVYEVRRRIPGGGPVGEWVTIATTEVSQWSGSPYDPGLAWEFGVRAVDTANNRGAWSDTVAVTVAVDTTAPRQPSAPSVTSRLGVAEVLWDGMSAVLDGQGAQVPMDADFREVRVYVSTAGANFPPHTVNLFGSTRTQGKVAVTGLAYATTYWARLVAYDTSGNASAPGPSTQFTVKSLVDAENFPDDAMTVLYARTAKFIDVTADMIQAGAIDGQVITAPVIRTSADVAAQRLVFDSTGLHGFGTPPGGGALTELTTIGTDGRLRASEAILTGALTAGDGVNSVTIGSSAGKTFLPGISFKEGSTEIGAMSVFNLGAGKSKGFSATAANWTEFNVGAVHSVNFVMTHVPTGTAGAYDERSFTFQGPRAFVVSMRGAPIQLLANGDTGGFFQVYTGNNASPSIQSSPDGSFLLPRHETTTNGTNMNINQSSGLVRRVTSRRADKVAIEPIPLNRLTAFMGVPVVTWMDRMASERHAGALAGNNPDDGDPLVRIPGMIAEDVQAAGLREFVQYDEDGGVIGLAYDRVGVAWVPLVKDLRDRVAKLEKTILALRLPL